jgi:hypothetical protein
MKLFPALVMIVLSLSSTGFGQGVRMAPDSFPLEVGNRWIYDLFDESGAKRGTLEFGVEDFRIVSGSSFYVLTDFPFTLETSRIRLVRYDRQERQFMRVAGTDEGPLFMGDGTTTEVLQADAGGSPQKFVLKRDGMALTFERGVGIIAAQMELPSGARTAKLSSIQGKGLTSSGSSAVTAVSGKAPLPPTVATPVLPVPGDEPGRRVETITAVTATNPRLDIFSLESGSSDKLVLVVENLFDKLLPFKFTSGQNYDFIITDPGDGREIWRWSRGQAFTQVVRSEAIRGDGKWTFEVLWNRRDNNGNPVPPGQYHLMGILTSQPPIQSSRVILAIQ